jgi:serine/threonine-protein kinase RsbW
MSRKQSPGSSKRRPEVKTQSLQVESRTEQLVNVRDFIASAARAFGFNDEEVGKIILAADEACTNVIKHAYKFDPTKLIHVIVESNDDRFDVVIRDSGAHFNPNKLAPPDMKEYFSHFRRGGLGVHLMKKLMDNVEYKDPKGHVNEVRLTKYRSR